MSLCGAGKTWFLSRVKEGVYASASRRRLGTAAPLFKGTVGEYAADASNRAVRHAADALNNSVKVCPRCGKPNGFTLATCNKCQADLSAVGLSATPNLFTAFMLGIERGPSFPLRVSLRAESDEVLVFDDPLALSPLHFCAIPTTVFIPDWRYLTLLPQRGHAVLRQLTAACHEATREQFLANDAWRASVLREAATPFDPEAHMLIGLNYPPSQNQLHIQYILPAMMPHQYMMFLRGVHFTPRRFFPLAYVEDCLAQLHQRGARVTMEEVQSLDVDQFITLLQSRCGVDYDAHHAAFMEKADTLHHIFANWGEGSFAGRTHIAESKEGMVEFEAFDGAAEKSLEEDEHVAFEREKRVLHNYGVSADPSIPAMGYYSHAKPLSAIDFSFLDQ